MKPPRNKLVLLRFALWAHLKITGELTAVNFIVIIESYIIARNDQVQGGGGMRTSNC